MQLMHAIYTLTFIEIAIIELTSCINNPSMNTVITLFFKESYKYVKKITDYYYYHNYLLF